MFVSRVIKLLANVFGTYFNWRARLVHLFREFFRNAAAWRKRATYRSN